MGTMFQCGLASLIVNVNGISGPEFGATSTLSVVARRDHPGDAISFWAGGDFIQMQVSGEGCSADLFLQVGGIFMTELGFTVSNVFELGVSSESIPVCFNVF